MADIIKQGNRFSFFLGTDGEFKVEQAWLEGLQIKLQKMTDAEIEVTLNDRADHLSIRAIGECKSDKLDLDRLMRRLRRAADWYMFWHRRGVRVFKFLVYKDRRLGTFSYDRYYDQWKSDSPTIVEVDGKNEPEEIWISFQGLQGKHPPKKALNLARQLIANLPSLEPVCLKAIADELLDTYNTMGWRGDNPEMSRDEFVRHFSLNSLNVKEDELSLCFYPEEEFFTDHDVEVILVDGKVAEVGLQG